MLVTVDPDMTSFIKDRQKKQKQIGKCSRRNRSSIETVNIDKYFQGVLFERKIQN